MTPSMTIHLQGQISASDHHYVQNYNVWATNRHRMTVHQVDARGLHVDVHLLRSPAGKLSSGRSTRHDGDKLYT